MKTKIMKTIAVMILIAVIAQMYYFIFNAVIYSDNQRFGMLTLLVLELIVSAGLDVAASNES